MIARKIHRKGEIVLIADIKEENDSHWAGLRKQAAAAFPYATLRITIEPPLKESPNMKLIGYWYAEVVPKVRAALIEQGTYLNHASTEQWINDHLQQITKEEVSYTVLHKFLAAIVVDRKTGFIKEVVPMLNELTDAEFSKLFDPLICWVAQNMGVQIMYPNEWE